MPRRDQTPPYEIMRSTSRASTSSPAEPAPAVPEPEPAIPTPTPKPSNRAPWWVGSSSPLVLRVPRGLAILSVIGLLLLIVIAYWVGAVRGAAAVEPTDVLGGIGDRLGPQGWYEADRAVYSGPEVKPPEEVLFEDRREPGMWYLRLMSSKDVEDCRKLAEFMRSRGVAIQIVISDNGRSVAYAIDRAYRTDEKDQPPAQHYLGWMKQRGREWKLHNGGRGDDLSTMYYAQAKRPDRDKN